ncbi:hypothetical protein QQ045_003579 [Rhodiola kirilowii]
MSLVRKRWYKIDSVTRKKVNIDNCYSTSPQRLSERFPNLEKLKVKGKPWASILKSIHFRRMIVKDSDLEALAQARGPMLLELKLDKCSGFSTDGLLRVAQSCRLWPSDVCAVFDFVTISCWFCLKCLGTFSISASLEEFSGGSQNRLLDDIIYVSLPATIQRLGLTNIRSKISKGLRILFPLGGFELTKLDLGYTMLKIEDHHHWKFPNLEVLEARDVIGDGGLEALAFNCKKLKRLRIERGEQGREGMVSHKGLEEIAQGCSQLEYLSVYVSDITNETLEIIGRRSGTSASRTKNRLPRDCFAIA